MSPAVPARVFEPFFTTKPNRQSTGLGLSMIYDFAKQSGGQVRIYSEFGQGTTVCIYLARHLGEVPPDDEEARAEARARTEQGETVLVVDDEPTVLMLVTGAREELGYTALEAADSIESLKILRSDARIDLLISGVGLRGRMCGRQMADAGREVRPDLRVLFIPGYAEYAAIGNGQLAPCMAVMTKPFDMDQLAGKISEIIKAEHSSA
jgi:CheY-like chemotaxis protein